ncbi:MAG: hypothetical protein R3C11_01470 [Planctomycetaceae bacterium]
MSFQIAFEKAVVNRKASETTFPLNQKNNVVRLVLYGCVVAATLLLGVSVSYYLQRANKTNPQNKPGGVESNFIPLRPSINLDDQNQIGSERPAKENVALLKELFTTLYRRGSLLSAWNEQNDDLMHYLENRGKSENYEALLQGRFGRVD